MRVGVVNEDIWDFFEEIYQDFSALHEVTLFKRRRYQLRVFNARINRLLLEHDLKAFMRSNRVLFFEWASELLALATQLPKSCGIVTRLHRYDFYEWADKVNWDAIDKVILVSRAKQERFIEKLPAQASKIVVIPEAVSLERFQPHKKAFGGNLGILCHLKPRKRVYDLILTFAELTNDVDGLHLHIGGDERPAYLDYHEALRSLVKRLHLEDQVTFHGHVKQAREWYKHVDVFLSNSYSEGLQVSPMEAIASGCYCLCHHWDGADELLPEEDLFFTNEELKQKIKAYCEVPDTEKEKRRAEQRARVCEKFDVNLTKVRIRELVEEVGRNCSLRPEFC